MYTAVGSPIVAKKMREVNAVFGGEESGGMIFPKFQYCRDPALAIVKMLECIIKDGPLQEQIDKLPVHYMEKRDIPCPESKKEALLEHIEENCTEGKTETIDGIDPAFAPGTGTPEPFGLHPLDVKKLINMTGDRLVGFDIMEVCPPADPTGITPILAARYIKEVMAVYGKNLRC